MFRVETALFTTHTFILSHSQNEFIICLGITHGVGGSKFIGKELSLLSDTNKDCL